MAWVDKRISLLSASARTPYDQHEHLAVFGSIPEWLLPVPLTAGVISKETELPENLSLQAKNALCGPVI